MRISLVYDSGFPWYSKEECHVKGFAHIPDQGYIYAENLNKYFYSSRNFEDFENRVSQANGMFSVIYRREGKIWMGVDRMRSFPLFYSAETKNILISDSVDEIIDSRGNMTLNQDAVEEFLAAGYVSGRETLADGIMQVQAGEVIELMSKDPALPLKAAFYSSYRTTQIREESSEVLGNEFHAISDGIFKRLINSLGGRTAVIALSGGYDSRFIAAMLKKLNYKDVICFSYGREGNPDMLLAEEVAGKLGFRFIPVIYTNELIEGYLKTDEFFDYVRFSANYVSMFFMQEYFALKYLKENKLIPEDSVLIPGHSGDFFGGSQLLKHGLNSGNEPIRTTIARIFEIKYPWFASGSSSRKIMLERIRMSLDEKAFGKNELPYTIHEDWDLKEKLAKFIVNSCNIYAWYGYQYRLPLYDYALQDFFRDLPFPLKANKGLYDEYLKNRVFEDVGLNFLNELQPDLRTQQKARLKSRIKKLLPVCLLPSAPLKQDPIFYNEITRVLKEDLASREITISIKKKSYNSLIVQWYIEYLKRKHFNNIKNEN